MLLLLLLVLLLLLLLLLLGVHGQLVVLGREGIVRDEQPELVRGEARHVLVVHHRCERCDLVLVWRLRAWEWAQDGEVWTVIRLKSGRGARVGFG